MTEPEFSRMVDARKLPAGQVEVEANESERAALAKRFDLRSVDLLKAAVMLSPDDDAVLAEGRLVAAIVQGCAVSGEDMAVRIDEELALRFVPSADGETLPDEMELESDDCDEIPFMGERFDLGEAVAQSLALAIDPYATVADAEKAREEAGLLDESDTGPFAALKALRKD